MTELRNKNVFWDKKNVYKKCLKLLEYSYKTIQIIPDVKIKTNRGIIVTRHLRTPEEFLCNAFSFHIRNSSLMSKFLSFYIAVGTASSIIAVPTILNHSVLLFAVWLKMPRKVRPLSTWSLQRSWAIPLHIILSKMECFHWNGQTEIPSKPGRSPPFALILSTGLSYSPSFGSNGKYFIEYFTLERFH